MTFYFTALVLEYAIGNNRVNVAVWYEKEEHCIEAMNDRLGDPLYNQLYDLYGTDIMMYCEVSDKVSYTIRPKLRNDGDGRQTLDSWQ